MANLPRKVTQLVREHETVPYIPNIDSLSDEILRKKGFYHGYPCVHDHTIRALHGHWCYHCAEKIRDNICGFDINYMNGNYKHKYFDLWRKIPVGNPEDCWEAPSITNKRLCMPSYRSGHSKQNSANVTTHKAIYQCAWGDIGAMFVTRICGNKHCLNPLHLISSWNRLFAPSVISPFEYEFKPEKLMQFARLKQKEDLKQIREHKYKRTIQHPIVHKNSPDYDERYSSAYSVEWPETS
jgi:hypothetical protein